MESKRTALKTGEKIELLLQAKALNMTTSSIWFPRQLILRTETTRNAHSDQRDDTQNEQPCYDIFV